jgi:hypothetical protein
MSKISLSGNASGTGTFTIASPNSNTDRTLTLPDNTGTILTTATPGVPVNGPAFSAYQSTAQTGLTTLGVSRVNFQTEEFDIAGAFNNTGSTIGTAPAYSFNPQVAGYYNVTACVTVASNTSTSMALATIFKNGSGYKDGSASVGLSVLFPRSNVSALVYMNGTTDYLQIYVYGTAAGSNFDISASSVNTYFQASLVRAA